MTCLSGMDKPSNNPYHLLNPSAHKRHGFLDQLISLRRFYENWITRNAESLGYLESGLRALLFMVPGRYRDSELPAEAGDVSFILAYLPFAEYKASVITCSLTLSHSSAPDFHSIFSCEPPFSLPRYCDY